MPLFRKKPVVVEAVQYTGRNGSEIGQWARAAEWGEEFLGGLTIPTLEGVMRADPGDWIIRGVAGEFYPCKPDIFAATYEPAAVLRESPAIDLLRRLVAEVDVWPAFADDSAAEARAFLAEIDGAAPAERGQ